MSRTSLLALPLLLCIACGSPPPPVDSPIRTSRERSSSLTVEEAEAIVARVQARRDTVDADNPLRSPKSLDDVEAILESDRFDLFGAGFRFAMEEGSERGKALAAEIAIVRGENKHVIAQLLDTFDADLREEIRELEIMEAAGTLQQADRARHDILVGLVRESDEVVQALSRLAPVHLAKGRELAGELLSSAPHGMEGHRLAADYYRMRGEWERFDAMVAEAKRLYPDVPQLLFLEAMELAERDNDVPQTTQRLREVLANHPKFVRARAHLVLLTPGVEAKYKEYLALRSASPHHQVVVLLGPVLERAREAAEKRAHRERKFDWR
jgi:hypothetical protein